MKKEIYINSEALEIRIAVVEDGKLAEIYIERETSHGMAGNIYKGKVEKVLPGIQSAFVNVGLERDTFLHVSDVVADFKSYPEFVAPGKRNFRTVRIPDDAKVENYLKPGQEILVQIAKEMVGTKGARVTMRIALPGRYFVYMPGTGLMGISKRIENRETRNRLRRAVTAVRQPSDGFITRTAAETASEDELKRDMQELIALWENIKKTAKASRPATLVHTDVDPIVKILRDHLSKDVVKMVIDSRSAYEKVYAYVERFSPDWPGELVPYKSLEPIFDHFGIEEEIQRSLESKVWLPSGGHLVINQTEALVAIDVNTGRFVGSKNLEDTVFRLNMEAVAEVVRQIRLRDLGGIIVVDFIDMENSRNRQRVTQAFREELRKDRAQSKILQISDFGLIEMTRKRSRTNLQRMLCVPCPYCDGAGRVKSEQTLMLEIRRKVLKLATSLRGDRILIKGHPDVIDKIRRQDNLMEDIERASMKTIALRPEPTYHQEQYDVLAAPRE